MRRFASRHSAHAVAALLLGLGHPALAAGGPHVVDDASVETAGTCHLESWATRFRHDSGLVNISPACTREDLPDLEIGAALQHGWDGERYTFAGPALKLNLRPPSRRIGMAVSAAAMIDTRTGRLDTASAVMPFTVPLGGRLSFSANVGYSYARASTHRHSLFWGGQIERRIGQNVTLIAEGFGRASGPAGMQAGLRWNPNGGAVDLDFLAGRYIDGASPEALTIGLTVRR